MKSRKYIHTYSSNYIIEIFPPGLVLQSDQPIRTYVIYKYIIYKICSSDRWALNIQDTDYAIICNRLKYLRTYDNKKSRH